MIRSTKSGDVRAAGPFRSALSAACILALLFGSVGCRGKLPPAKPRQPVSALAQDEASKTPLGGLVARAAPSGDISGFRLLSSGREALGALIALADNAKKTLDLQYYLIRGDGSSRAIMRHVWLAANRGVRVRLLLDDLNTAGQDESLMRLTRHPNIDVRLYNPLPAGRLYIVSRLLSSLTDLKRINHRMHNKMFVADNVLAVTGGRNLGDSYFLRDKDSNFLDIDVLVAGPAVRALSQTFDRFWNDPLAYPAAEVAGLASVDAGATNSSSVLKDTNEASEGIESPGEGVPAELGKGQLRLHWVRAHVLADKPSKVDKTGPVTEDEVIHDDINELMLSAHKELVLMTPYFVPGQHGIDLFKELRRRGVKVRILTNSLATTDAPAVHIGYSRYRESLLELGVEIYELKPDARMPRRTSIGSFGSSRASLHAKVMIIDGGLAIVGSMNLDPRSANLNTEMGVVMHSAELVGQLMGIFEEAVSHSYRLSLAPDRRIQWQTHPPDPMLNGKHEPGTSRWLKIGLMLLGPFAPDEML